MIRYQGVRDSNGVASVWITTEQGVHGELPLRLDLGNHSPTGFEWGYQGSGPHQLAIALIAHALDSDEWALAYSQDFKRFIISRLGHDGWDMSRQDVIDAVRGLHNSFLREVLNVSGILDAEAIRARSGNAIQDEQE